MVSYYEQNQSQNTQKPSYSFKLLLNNCSGTCSYKNRQVQKHRQDCQHSYSPFFFVIRLVSVIYLLEKLDIFLNKEMI